MARFSVKDLLIATTMVGIGLDALVIAAPREVPSNDFGWMAFSQAVLLCGGASLIGYGVAIPFKQAKRIGNWISIILMCVLVFFMY